MSTSRSGSTRLRLAVFAITLASAAALAQPAAPQPAPTAPKAPRAPTKPTPPTAPTAPATPAKDTQAKYEPPAGPGAGQDFLKTFEGQWTVERNFYPPSGGPASKATGECTQKMVQDGRFLQSDFTFHQDGKTTTGTGISGFDPQTGLFTTFWYDSRSTRFSIRQSRDPFDGKQMVLYSAALAASHGQDHQSRTVSHLEDSGRKLVHQEFNADASGKEAC